MKHWIFTMFQNTKIESQKQFDEYSVDFYFPDLYIIVELDKQSRDFQKEETIKNILWQEIIEENHHLVKREKSDYIKFVRIEQGKEIEAIRELLFTIEDLTWSSPTKFMR